MFIVKWIIGILKALNTNVRPSDIGAGIAFALLLALMPAGNLLWILILCLTFFLRVHGGMMFIFLAIFKLLAPLADPLLHFIGLQILAWPVLQPAFTALYELPIVPFTQFNNTLVMGGLVLGLLLWVPVCLLFAGLVNLYREKLQEKVENSPLVKAIKQFPLVNSLAGLIRKASAAGRAQA